MHVLITDADNGKQFVLGVNGAATLKLGAAAGTGYGWSIVKNDPTILVEVGPPQFVPGDGSGLGTAEFEVFEFNAKSAGTDSLELVYERPWEKSKPPQKTFTITITVK